MTKDNKISVALRAEDEYGRAVGMVTTTGPPPGGGWQDYGSIANSSSSSQGASLAAGTYSPGAGGPYGAGISSPGAGALPGDGAVSVYAQRLDAERAFQSQRLGIISLANLEVSAVMGRHSDEQVSREKENNEIKKGNTKALVATSLSLMSKLMSGSKKNNKAMFEAEKAYSVGKAMMNAYSGASKAFETYAANPPMAALMAGIALAKGIAMARSIAGQKMTKSVGSGGGSTAGAGASAGIRRSTASYAGGEGAGKKGTQNLTVNIYNPLSDENWQKVVEDNIIPALEEAGERNVIMKVNV